MYTSRVCVRGLRCVGKHVQGCHCVHCCAKITTPPSAHTRKNIRCRLCVALLLRIKPGGYLHMAPVCSSWVFINRATSCRTAANPLGDTTKGYVGTGNKQAARCSALALIASWRNLVWTLEQPASSLFHLHPRWQWLLGHLQIWRHGFNMGAYGASSMKPSVLWANVPWVCELDRKLAREYMPRDDGVVAVPSSD